MALFYIKREDEFGMSFQIEVLMLLKMYSPEKKFHQKAGGKVIFFYICLKKIKCIFKIIKLPLCFHCDISIRSLSLYF